MECKSVSAWMKHCRSSPKGKIFRLFARKRNFARVLHNERAQVI
ncbi:Hypothetical protein BIBO1_0449 [Brucella inopinata BO1]|nr:Hypothetical protein BIBO1_0449 [Brucella inopinata BO1]